MRNFWVWKISRANVENKMAARNKWSWISMVLLKIGDCEKKYIDFIDLHMLRLGS